MTERLSSITGLSWLVTSVQKKEAALKIVGVALVVAAGLKVIKIMCTRAPFPGPSALSVLCMPFLSPEKQIEKITNISNEYGKICSFRLLTTTVVLVSDMEIFRKVAKSRPTTFSGAQVPNLLGQCSVVFLEGDDWKVHRKIVSRHLIDSSVNSMLPMICSVADNMMQNLHTSCNAEGVVTRWGPEDDLVMGNFNIASAVFVGEPNPQQSKDLLFNDDFVKHARSFITREMRLSISPVAGFIAKFPLLYYFHPRLRKLFADWVDLKASWKGIIEYNLSNRSRNANRNMLPSVLDHAGRQFDMKELVSTLHLFVATGMDTVSASTSLLLKSLCLNPEVQERARAEALSLPRDPETLEELDKLVYLKACIFESLRLNLPGPVLPVAALRDCEIEGKPIRAGTRVVIMLKKMLLESREDGADFKPERWLTKDGENIDPREYRDFMSFGYGPRKCPGRHLAMKTMLVYISRLLRHFKNIRLAEGSTAEVKYASVLIMHPRNFYLTMEVST